MKRKRKIFLSVVILVLLFQTVTAAGEDGTAGYQRKSGEVVFLLDASSSMNTQDKNRLAIDVIRQAAYSLPSNYKTGLVVYNTEIQGMKALDADMGQLESQLEAVVYSGYTNAGQGLSQAVGLFSEAENTDRYIIMLSDGEIDMPNKKER